MFNSTDGFVKVSKTSDIPTRCGKLVKVGIEEIALFKVDGEIIAVTNVCPHQHFSLLHQGKLDGSLLTCPMHGTVFDLHSGESTNGSGKLKKFEVLVAGDDVWVEQTEGA